MAAWLKPLRVFSISAAALAAGVMFAPDIAEAQFGGGIPSGIVGGFMRHGFPGGGGGGYRHRHNGGGGGGDESPSGGQGGKQDHAKNNENAVLLYETAEAMALNQNSEESRNVGNAITSFITVLEQEHRKLRNSTNANVRASTGSNINQITEGEIRASVDKAYEETHLTDFDTLAGELWTRDRLQVQILREAEKGILPYFNGVGARGPDMNNLQEVFKEAAVKVYARALELSEIIGVSRSFDHFIRTIYENSDQAPEGLWTVGADVQYERMLTRVINDVDHTYFIANRVDIENQRAATLAVRLSHQFDFRFRARRALYDCLSAGYVALISKSQSASPQIGAGSGGSRGAKIDIFARPGTKTPSAKPATPDVVNVVESGDSAAEVWKRAQQVVGEKCREITKPFARTASESGLKPISARTDLAVAAGLAFDRSGGQYLQIRTGDPR